MSTAEKASLAVPEQLAHFKYNEGDSVLEIMTKIVPGVKARVRELTPEEKRLARLDQQIVRARNQMEPTLAMKLCEIGRMTTMEKAETERASKRKDTEYYEVFAYLKKHQDLKNHLPRTLKDENFPSDLKDDHYAAMLAWRDSVQEQMRERRQIQEDEGLAYPIGSLKEAQKAWKEEEGAVEEWKAYLTEKGKIGFVDKSEEIADLKEKQEAAVLDIDKDAYQAEIDRLIKGPKTPAVVRAVVKMTDAMTDYPLAEVFGVLREAAEALSEKPEEEQLDLVNLQDLRKMEIPGKDARERAVNSAIISAYKKNLKVLDEQERAELGAYVLGQVLRGKAAEDKVEFAGAVRTMAEKVLEAAGYEMPEAIYQPGEVAAVKTSGRAGPAKPEGRPVAAPVAKSFQVEQTLAGEGITDGQFQDTYGREKDFPVSYTEGGTQKQATAEEFVAAARAKMKEACWDEEKQIQWIKQKLT